LVTFTNCAGAVVDTVCDPNVNDPGKIAIAVPARRQTRD
jgi:hypothetical protein